MRLGKEPWTSVPISCLCSIRDLRFWGSNDEQPPPASIAISIDTGLKGDMAVAEICSFEHLLGGDGGPCGECGIHFESATDSLRRPFMSVSP